MKRYATLFIISILTLLAACSEDESKPSAEKKFLADLAGTWNVSSVTLDSENVNEEFENLTITFKEDRTFAVTNPVGNIWPSTGTFELQKASGELFNLMRDDDVLISVDAMTGNSLTLSMQFDSAPGRLRGLTGEYSFTFTK